VKGGIYEEVPASVSKGQATTATSRQL